MKTSKFQIVVLSIFVIFIIAGVIGFATYKGSKEDQKLPPITVWGTFPRDRFDQYVSGVNNRLTNQVSVKYVELKQEAFLNEFIGALARGTGPDAILVPADMLLSTQDKLTAIPFSIYPAQSFYQQFIDEARVYVNKDGILGLPFSVDPLVMYWNRDRFNETGVALPPRYWDEFKELNKKMTVRSESGTVTKSAIAMGDFGNVTNARELLGSIMMQAGNPVTSLDQYGIISSAIKPAGETSPVPAVTFFTQFVDPSNENYSWNRSWPESKTAFVSGKLATYFGFSSELFSLRDRNPNLSYDVAPLPQFRTGGRAATYGRMFAFSLVKQSKQTNAAFQIIYTLVDPQFLESLTNDSYLPSVSRSLIARGSKDAYIQAFNEQALIARSWLDADPNASRRIFGEMIQAITTGSKSVYEALNDASLQYDDVLRKAQQ